MTARDSEQFGRSDEHQLRMAASSRQASPSPDHGVADGQAAAHIPLGIGVVQDRAERHSQLLNEGRRAMLEKRRPVFRGEWAEATSSRCPL
jgi:hypothetical protein